MATGPPRTGVPLQVEPAAPKHLIGDDRVGLGPLSLALAAVVLGLAGGLGALVFRVLIALVHNAFFLGRLSLHYDATTHTPAGPFGHAVLLAPVVGAVLVVFLVKNFAPEAKGHGVPEVIDAIYYAKSVIRPVVAAIKSLASAISIGSGGSVGREGPIVQISAAFASWLGGVARVSRWQRATLVAAGGGAGIAATFNTPLGGVLFAVEVLMHEVSVRTLVPVALATTTATYVGERFFGNAPAFEAPTVHPGTAAVLPGYVLLGAVMGVVAVLFIRALYGSEVLFERLFPRNDYVRHVAGMFGVGVTIELLMMTSGHYYVEGVGYATIADILAGGSLGAGWLVVFFALKLLTTSLTLGSGGSGGVFSPSLFMGATLGGAFGLLVRGLLPSGIPFDPAAFALAGMAGIVAGATGAALTAIVMIFEMTREYVVVLPMALTVAVSLGVRRLLMKQSIYTMKLARRRHYVSEALQANAHLVHHVGDLRMESAVALAADAAAARLEGARETRRPAFIVLNEGARIVGVVESAWSAEHDETLRAAASLASLARRDFVVVRSDTTLFELIEAMQRTHAQLAVVLGVGAQGETAPTVCGVVTKSDIVDALADGMEIFAD